MWPVVAKLHGSVQTVLFTSRGSFLFLCSSLSENLRPSLLFVLSSVVFEFMFSPLDMSETEGLVALELCVGVEVWVGLEV